MDPSLKSSLYSVIAVVILVVFVVSLIYFNNYTNTTLKCQPGDCPTSIETGKKRCSTTGEALSYDPAFEVCNSADSCDNPITSYAVLPNGGTDSSGVCVTEMCNCSTTAKCPSWISVAFKDNGMSYTQLPLIPGTVLPPNYTCYVPAAGITKVGCYAPNVDTTDPSTLQEEVKDCLSLYPECGDIPLCRTGILAFVDDGLSSRYACINSTECACGTVTILNPVDGSITCSS